jgi:hypothetical protein
LISWIAIHEQKAVFEVELLLPRAVKRNRFFGTAEGVPLSKTGIIPLELSVTAVTFRVRGAV